MLLVSGTLAGGYMYWRQSLPPVTGTLALPGLQAPVTVLRDAWGVPHIFATTRYDLYMAQGYVTAQDRLFQMDVSRRAASGRLSEVIGEATLDTDRFFRSLMLRPAAEASVAAYPPEMLEILQAYADGVNAWMQAGNLPLEFTLLSYRPEPWSPVDSAVIGKYMAYDLGGNWAAEVWRFQAIQRLGAARVAEILPTYPADGPTVMKYTAMDIDMADLVRTAYIPTPGLGSNNWVVSGSRTAAGKPLLANDPHLGISTPAIWYLTHLVLPDEQMNVTGATFAGAPGVVLGHNENVAWGVTNLDPDVQDLYIEQPNPENPQEFLYKGLYEPATVRAEEIRVKGRKEPVPFTLLVTRHGPIITPVAGTKENRPAAALALRWTALGPTRELEAIIVLKQNDRVTVADMQALQLDEMNLQARTLLPMLLPALEKGLSEPNPAEKTAVLLLKEWDQIDRTEAAAPLIFHQWYLQLREELFQPAMGDELFGQMSYLTQITDRLLLNAGQGRFTSWLPEGALPEVAARSFRKAVSDLAAAQGRRPDQWQWGKFHRVAFNHPLGQVKPLNLLFNVGPFALGGSSATVRAASYHRRTGLVSSAAPWRQVVDLGNLARNSFDIVTPGQSGHPLSPHYDDQSKLWLKGDYRAQLFTEEQLQGARRLELIPH